MAGKGDKLRPGANLKKYWNNYDAIFRKDKAEDNAELTTMSDYEKAKELRLTQVTLKGKP